MMTAAFSIRCRARCVSSGSRYLEPREGEALVEFMLAVFAIRISTLSRGKWRFRLLRSLVTRSPGQ